MGARGGGKCSVWGDAQRGFGEVTRTKRAGGEGNSGGETHTER